MESKASTLLMTHKKVPLMVTLFETLDGFILDLSIQGHPDKSIISKQPDP
jgi:hypothetical protein